MDERLVKLSEILQNEKVWPQLYFFKFIIPNEKEKLESVRNLFAYPDKITYRTSRDIRYIGVSCKEWMQTPEAIIAIYEKAYSIQGVIAL